MKLSYYYYYNNMPRILIFTDGSYTALEVSKDHTAKAGIGVFYPQFQQFNLSETLPFEKKTNNRAELWAIIRSLQKIKENAEIFNLSQASYIKIYTDSMLMVKTFNLWIKGWINKNYEGIKNIDLLKIANAIIQDFKIPVKFKHVRGHQAKPKETDGKEWLRWYCNNEADRLAKNGSYEIART